MATLWILAKTSVTRKSPAIEVKGAESGSGEGIVEIVESKSGDGLYDGETDTDEQMMQVHAGDDSTYLKFT